MDDSRRSFDPRAFQETLAKRKWHLLVPLVLATATSFVVVERMPEVYAIESVLLFETAAPLTGEVERHLLPGTGPSRGREEDRRNEANLLRIKVRSPDFLGELAEEMGFLNDPAGLERAAAKKAESGDPKTPEEIFRQDVTAWLASMIEVNLAGTNIYMITMKGNDRDLLFRMSNLMNSKLLEMVQNEQLGRLRAASAFTDEQITVYKTKLDEARRELDRFLVSQPLARSEPTFSRIDAGAAVRLADETGYEILRISEREQESSAMLTQMYGFNVDAFLDGARPSVSLLAEKLVSLEKQLGFLLLERSWNDPTVIAHNTRIGEARSEIEDAGRRLARSLLLNQPGRVQELAGDVLRDRILLDALSSRKGALEQQTVVPSVQGPSPAVLSRRAQEFSFLEEQVRINEGIYNSFLRQATSARISEAVESEQFMRSVRMIRAPQWPAKPASPNRPQVIGLGILIGLALGVAGMMFGEYFDTSVKDVRQAEEIVGAPILGTIPLIEYRFQPKARGGFWNRGTAARWVGGILVALLVGFLFYRSRAGVAEENAEAESAADGGIVNEEVAR
jgi:uncharacterized protein involved in exopolysaccharide biosynthesis